MNPETLPITLPPQNALQECLHEKHWHTRYVTIMALEESYHQSHKSLAYRLATCANGARIYVAPTLGRVRPWISRCGSRLCPFCARRRSQQTATRIYTATLRMKEPRTGVLTVKSTDGPLARQLAALRNAFAKLRKAALWKKAVTSGIYTIETTRNPQSGQWHPHIHFIFDGRYIPQKALRIAWRRATGTAEIVWIAQVRDRQTAAAELAKYVGKPQQITEWPNEAIREYATAAHRQRMIHTFGKLHGQPITDQDHRDVIDAEEYAVPISRILKLATLGVETPGRLIRLIATRFPMFGPYIDSHLPMFEPAESTARKFLAMSRALRNHDPPPQRLPTDGPSHDEQDKELLTYFRRYKIEDDLGLYETALQAQYYRSVH